MGQRVHLKLTNRMSAIKIPNSRMKNAYFVVLAGKQKENKSENTGLKSEKINDKGETRGLVSSLLAKSLRNSGIRN